MLDGASRPRDVYCNGWKPKDSTLRHEILLTDVLMAMNDIEVRRGYEVDKDVQPDAEIWIGKRHFYMEMDTGTMSHWHVKRKWAKRYMRVIQRVREGSPEFLLVVCVTERRLKGLVERSEPVKDIALYSTVERVMSDPWGKVWLDANGKEGSLRNY